MKKIAESLKANGQYRPIVVQRSTRQVLAGNHTFMAAESLGWQTILVTWVDVSDAEARRIVLADNRTSDEGGYEEDVLADLLTSILEDNPADLLGTGYDEDEAAALTGLLEALEEDGGEDEGEDQGLVLDEGETVDDIEVSGLTSLNPPPTSFPGSNEWGFPALLPDMIPDLEGKHLESWAGPDLIDAVTKPPDLWVYDLRATWAPSTKGMPWGQTISTLFTDDHRFEDVWTQPEVFAERLLALGLAGAVEPDFSAWSDDPPVVQMWSFYRARFIGRFWQEVGVPVIPLIGVYRSHGEDFGTMGCPAEPASACINLQLLERGTASMTYGLKMVRETLRVIHPGTLVVYGSEPAREVLSEVSPSCHTVLVEPMNRKRRRINRDLPAPNREED